MKKTLLLTLLFAGAAGCGEQEKNGNMSAAEVAGELSEMRMQPGQWEATYEVLAANIPGMPADMAKQMLTKTSVRNCLTPEEAAKPEADFLTAQKDSSCTYKDWSMSGGSITGTMTCSGEGGPMTMTMNGEYDRTSYTMNMDMKMEGGVKMTMKSRAAGRRVGECTGEEGKAG